MAKGKKGSKSKPSNSNQQPQKTNGFLKFRKPIIFLLAILVITAILGFLLAKREKQNIVLKPDQSSQVFGLSHPIDSLGEITASDPITGYNAFFEASGSIRFLPEDKQNDFVFKITTTASKITFLQSSDDGKEYLPFYDYVISDQVEMTEIEFYANEVSFPLDPEFFDKQIKVNAQQFGVLYNPAGFTYETKSFVVGEGLTESNSETFPHLLFITLNGESILNMTGAGTGYHLSNNNFTIYEIHSIRVNNKEIDVELPEAPIQISILGNSSSDNSDVSLFDFGVLFVQGTFGYADIAIDKNYPFNFETFMPYIYVKPPSGTLVFGSQSSIALFPEQNSVEIFGSYSEPLSLKISGGPPDGYYPYISGVSDYVYINDANQVSPTKWELLGEGIQATLVAALLAALGFLAVEIYQSIKS